MTELTQEHLKSILHYDLGTGHFIWLGQEGSRGNEGSIAGTLMVRGYRQIKINKKGYYAHRLVYLYVFGRWPKKHIDHINNNKEDNRLTNLRECNPTQNMANRCMPSDNTSGFKGVNKIKNTNKWRSIITVKGKQKYLGSFSSKKEAAQAYNAEALKIYGEFAYLNKIEDLK